MALSQRSLGAEGLALMEATRPCAAACRRCATSSAAWNPTCPGSWPTAAGPLGTHLVEGINNRINVIKRVAYGYRDDAYFFLKIRAAFLEVG